MISLCVYIVGAPCSSIDEIRLVGGVDEFQGRVEVCTEALVYSTVCSSGWDIRDAQVVCRELGLVGNYNTGLRKSICVSFYACTNTFDRHWCSSC